MTAPDLTKLTSLHKAYYGHSFSRIAPNPAHCCEGVWQSSASYQCSRRRGHGPEGAYCKQHDPAAAAARKSEKEARWRAEWAENARKSELARLAPEMRAALIAIRDGHNDPSALAADVLGEFKHDRA